MLTAYIQAAMRHAQYKILPGDDTYFGAILATPGVWAQADTLEASRQELQEVLEDWITLGLASHQPLPVIDGLDITPDYTTAQPW